MSIADFEQSQLADQIAASFGSDMMDEVACRRFLLPLLRPEMTCPICRTSYDHPQIDRVLDGKDVICGCGRKSAPRAGTVLDGVHASYRQIMLMTIMLHWDINKAEVARRTNISDDTIRRLASRLGAR